MTAHTFCESCQHVMKKGPSYAWTCQKFPRKEGFGFVTRDVWDREVPHMRCTGINGGACPVYQEVRDDGEVDV